MSERTDLAVEGGSVPVIPYDAFEAATLFLATNYGLAEVLPLLGLSEAEWHALRDAYRWMPYSFGENHRKSYFRGLSDTEVMAAILQPRWNLPADQAADITCTWNIREAARKHPFIGPFKNCKWPLTVIGADAEATLVCYTHDGKTVYFNGKPLADRQGTPLPVAPETFSIVGGRWLRDKNHIYGRGQYGSRPTPYWYIVENSDAASFEMLNLRYARDRNQAYYITGKTIRTKSPEAFAIIPELRLNYRDNCCDFLHERSILARDREHVYFYGARLKGARPATFRDLGHEYATDGYKVWFLEQKKMIEGADAATFVVPGPGAHVAGPVSGHGVTDRYRPYLYGEPSDPQESFEAWRPFFEMRPDLQGWWWHDMAKTRRLD